MKKPKIRVIGGGLAGAEAVYRLSREGFCVDLIEMKPVRKSPAHKLDTMCELVCSNSLKSESPASASGLLKAEMRMLDSIVLQVADECRVPAGSALAVDRELFSEKLDARLRALPGVNIINEVADGIDTDDEDCYTIVATGPLTDDALMPAVRKLTGDGLYFFDAASPIITAESIDYDSAFSMSRYGKGGNDYVNCPMDREEYTAFYEALRDAECVELKDFEGDEVFEGCMPIEAMAKRGADTMRFGPLRPVGLTDERTGKRPYAVLQLRQENEAATLYNLVGFQTHLTFPEQKRVFSMIPALKNAEFVRFGVMHRNTYVNSPECLNPDLSAKACDRVYFAGQITGVEGYMESAMCGIVAGLNLARRCKGENPIRFPDTTITGALIDYVTGGNCGGDFQPMNANFGILPKIENVRDKAKRKEEYYLRATEAMRKVTEKPE